MPYSLLEYADPEPYGYDGSGIGLDEIEFHDEENLIEKLGDFFWKEYSDDLSEPHARRQAYSKAESLLQNDFDKGKILSQFNYQKGKERAIKKAINHGYIWNITIEKPWHPKIFIDDSYITTYCHQHEYVVLFSGQKKHIFFKESGKQDLLEDRGYDHFRNAGSILGQGYLEPDGPNRMGEERKSYYTPEIEAAYSYGSGGDPPLYSNSVILEACIPREILHYQTKSGFLEERMGFDSLSKLHEVFEAPLNFSPSYGNSEFHVKQRLPLKNIMRVWDIERSKDIPNFQPLNKYARTIKHDFPDRVPDLSNTNLTAPERISREEYEKREKMAKEIESISETVIDYEIGDPYSHKNINGTYSSLDKGSLHWCLRGLKEQKEAIYRREARGYTGGKHTATTEHSDLMKAFEIVPKMVKWYDHDLEKIERLLQDIIGIEIDQKNRISVDTYMLNSKMVKDTGKPVENDSLGKSMQLLRRIDEELNIAKNDVLSNYPHNKGKVENELKTLEAEFEKVPELTFNGKSLAKLAENLDLGEKDRKKLGDINLERHMESYKMNKPQKIVMKKLFPQLQKNIA